MVAGRDRAIWNIDRPSAATSHPTEKPAEIFARSMRNNTEAGEICTSRSREAGRSSAQPSKPSASSYALEIEPKYVAVALERMSDMASIPN